MGVWVAAIAAAAGIAQGAMASSSARGAARAKQAAYDQALGYIGSLRGMSSGDLAAAFGDKLNPEEFLYHPVDLTQSQMDTIKGNIKAFPSAADLSKRVNKSIWKNDLRRIRTLMPQFDRARDSYIGTTRMLQEGRLPFADSMGIISDSSSAAASSGTPGGSRNTTLKDLGLARLDAMGQGNSMFAQFMQVAQAISPVEHQMRPQQMMFTPQERAQMDIQQATLEAQGRAAAETARAMPDPAMNALVNAEMGINMAALGGQYMPSSGNAALAAGIQGAAGIASAYYGNRPQQAAPQQAAPQQAPQYGGYGGGGYGYGSGGPDGYYNPYPSNTMTVQQSPYSQFDYSQGVMGTTYGTQPATGQMPGTVLT
jgi:hypothetical protein